MLSFGRARSARIACLSRVTPKISRLSSQECGSLIADDFKQFQLCRFAATPWPRHRGCLFVIVKTPDYTDFTNAAPPADLWISCSSDFRLLTSEVLPASGLSPPGVFATPDLSRGEFMPQSAPQDVRPQHPKPRLWAAPAQRTLISYGV